MDRLDAGRDAAGANRPRSAGSTSWTCSILGMNGVRPAVGVSASSAARTAASPMAWIWVAIPPAAARSTSSRNTSPASTRPRADASGEAVGRARVRCRPAAPRSATRATRRRTASASRPAPGRPGPRRGCRRSGARRRARSRARRRGSRRGRGPAASRARTGRAYAGYDQLEIRVVHAEPGIVRGDDAEGEQLLRDGHDRRLQLLDRRTGDVLGDQPGRLLEQHPLGLAVRVAADDAAGRIGRRAVDPADARAARLARSAWWSCAQSTQRRPGATVSRSAAVGQPPHRSASQP